MSKTKQSPTLLDLIAEEVDFDTLVDKIQFADNELIEAILEQSKLHFEASKLRVQCMHKRNVVESKLALKTSLLSQRYRRMKNQKSGRDLTEGAVKALVDSESDIIKLKSRLNKAIAEEELAKQLVDVYRSRRDVIRIIIDSGKISLQAQELAILKGNKKLRSIVTSISERHRLMNI